MGDVMIYELPSHERIAIRNFKVWDLGTCSMVLQVWISIIISSFNTEHQVNAGVTGKCYLLILYRHLWPMIIQHQSTV